jgi:hypothetical protein
MNYWEPYRLRIEFLLMNMLLCTYNYIYTFGFVQICYIYNIIDTFGFVQVCYQITWTPKLKLVLLAQIIGKWPLQFQKAYLVHFKTNLINFYGFGCIWGRITKYFWVLETMELCPNIYNSLFSFSTFVVSQVATIMQL